jgi:hypothetical protein
MEENFTAPHINHELFCSIMGHVKVRIRIATFEENCMGGSIWYHYLTAQPRQLQDEVAELMGRLAVGRPYPNPLPEG